MSGRDDAARTLFATVFLLSQSWKNLLDDMLAPAGLSAKQWMLLVAIETFGNEAPTLGEAADRYGTSRQAAKQLALRLERAGFVRIEHDSRDGRTLRLHLTARHREFWDRHAATHLAGLAALFAGVDDAPLASAADVAAALLATARAAEGRGDGR
ncbi:MarR family transcriptional regulator [Demequina maris]|uniref:MarR family transcriptional regulator n=1 Tax=Demequina maris TaxID=1638982 RepID=UPI00078273DB|nr:MarR family transcriptional regulator [Demequina maris]